MIALAAAGLPCGALHARSAVEGMTEREGTLGRIVAYPMSEAVWVPEPPETSLGRAVGKANFARFESMPTGTMTLNEGVAGLRGATFGEGEIEFDIKPIGYDDAGIIFHRLGAEDGEFFYLRANPECPAANDCIQYAPVTHGLMAWNIYPNYQRSADISTTGWNHVRLVIAHGGMTVYLNHSVTLALAVPRLEGLTRDGGIGLKGPAVFANLRVSPVNPGDIPAPPAERPIAGTIMSWLAAPPTPYVRSQTISADDAPAGGPWRPIETEPSGLVNLGRSFGTAHAPSLSLAWLRTTVDADVPVRRTLSFGFTPQAWVFLNGRLVYSGVNTYYPSEKRLSPDGRLEPDNAVVPLDLHKGANSIVVAVGNDWRPYEATPKPTPYGWGIEARLDSVDGIELR